jgi:hypothetical protein
MTVTLEAEASRLNRQQKYAFQEILLPEPETTKVRRRYGNGSRSP